MSTIQIPPTASTSGNALKITMTVFSAIGLAVWGTSIGFMLGWDYSDIGVTRVIMGSYISIPVNAAMIYVACRLIFLVMNRSFPSEETLQDLHQCVARMVAFTVLGFSTWITSVVWLSVDGDFESYIVYHACNYGFILSTVVAGLAGGLLTVSAKTDALPVHAVAPKYIAPQQSQAHYNQAYVHYGQHRM